MITDQTSHNFYRSQRGWRAAVWSYWRCNFDEPRDLKSVVEHIQAANPKAPISAVGYSAGGYLLMRYLSAYGDAVPLSCAVTVSGCFDFIRAFEDVVDNENPSYEIFLGRSYCHLNGIPMLLLSNGIAASERMLLSRMITNNASFFLSCIHTHVYRHTDSQGHSQTSRIRTAQQGDDEQDRKHVANQVGNRAVRCSYGHYREQRRRKQRTGREKAKTTRSLQSSRAHQTCPRLHVGGPCDGRSGCLDRSHRLGSDCSQSAHDFVSHETRRSRQLF